MSIARITRLSFIALLLVLAAISFALPGQAQNGQSQGTNTVLVLELDGIINPPAASYVESGIREAENINAEAAVLVLNTPGGLDDSSRDIVRAIDNARVPVIMFVAPQGARAASAGTYIGMASHLLAMAPGTTIGSATPILVGGGEVQDVPEDQRNKVINEAVSFIRAHAEMRGRNADWAEQSVREGANLAANAAVQQNVAELVAGDLDELLAEADGREVTLASGETRTLRTANANVQEYDMGLLTSFLHTIANPDIAFILLSLAILGIFFELANPGLFFPGVIGGVSLLLAFYSLGTLNAFWGGILLIFLALGLIIAEVVTPTYGILGFGGIVALIFGGALLFMDGPDGVQVSPWTLWAVAGIGGVTVVFFSWAILSTRRRNVAPTGYAALIGQTGSVKTHMAPDGYVLVHGERWRAHSLDGEAAPGDEIVVERAEGTNLWVRKKKGA